MTIGKIGCLIAEGTKLRDRVAALENTPGELQKLRDDIDSLLVEKKKTVEQNDSPNKVLKQNLGPKAPRLQMDMLGNQRISWVLAEELAMEEAFNELNETSTGGAPVMDDLGPEDES